MIRFISILATLSTWYVGLAMATNQASLTYQSPVSISEKRGACAEPIIFQTIPTVNSIRIEVEFESCGGRAALYEAGMTSPLFAFTMNAGLQNIEFTGLQTNTTYDVCLTNYCMIAGNSDCANFDVSTEICTPVTTLDTGCSPPTGLTVVSVGETFIRMQASFGANFGRAELYQGNSLLSSQEIMQSGLVEITASGLDANTTYRICVYNYCDTSMMVLSDASCRSATTLEGCTATTDLTLTRVTPFSFEATVTLGPFGARVWLIYPDQSHDEMIIEEGGFQTITSDPDKPLTPNKLYTLCVWNGCDDFLAEISEEQCIGVRTPPEECDPPPILEITEITSDSFVVTTELGPFGGTMDINGEGYSSQVAFMPEEESKLIQNLPSGTLFSISIVNECFDGTVTDPITATATTFSVRESHGLLTAPVFVGEDLISIIDTRAKTNHTPGLTITPLDHIQPTVSNKAALRTQLLLPDPNSDAWDRFGTATLAYVMEVKQGCDTLYSETISGSEWPQAFVIPMPIPTTAYEVHLKRTATVVNKEGEQQSTGTILVGPATDDMNSDISTEFLDIKRWILHVPKQGGGFRGTLTLHNRFPVLPADVYLAGFDDNGQYIDNTRLKLVLVGSRAEVTIYPDSQSGTTLFPANLTDQVSHIGMIETNNRHIVDTAITYQNINDPNALTATIAEADFETGASVGSFFTLESRKSDQFWDGIALLNLARNTQSSVTVSQRTMGTDAARSTVDLGSLAAGEKRLQVISDLFPICEDCYYSIEVGDNESIQVLGLRGSNTTDESVLVGSQVVKKK